MPRGPVKQRCAYADPSPTKAGRKHNAEQAHWRRLWVESADRVGFPVHEVDRERVKNGSRDPAER